jgi:UDP-glucose 4-epimerase
LTKHLVAEGWSVVATVRGSLSLDWTEDALAGAQIEVLSPTQNPRAMTDLLVRSKPHVAIICSGVAPVADPTGIPGLVDGNVAVPAVVLDACSRADIRRVLMLGSGFEYAPADGPIDEAGQIGPDTLYGSTKVAASSIASFFRDVRGVDACVARPFSVYGPRERTHRFVPYVVTAALTGRPIEMSQGTQSRDYLFVEDLADGLSRAASHEGPLPPFLNFSGGARHSLLDVATTVIELSRSQSPVYPGIRPPNHGDRGVFLGDSDLAKEVLGWGPRHELAAGLAKTIDWYRDHRSIWQDAA